MYLTVTSFTLVLYIEMYSDETAAFYGRNCASYSGRENAAYCGPRFNQLQDVLDVYEATIQDK
jgi:hypothetical protein